MITIPISTPRAISPPVTRKSELPPAAGCADALPLADGLATATTDRVGDGDGAALAGAAVDGTGVRDALGLAMLVDVGVGVAVAEAGAVAVGSAEVLAVGAGDGVVVLVPSDAHARESVTPGAAAHTDRAGVTHELPSAAARESDTRANG